MRFKKCVAVISFMASSLAFAGSDLKADQSFVQELEAGIQNLDTSFIQELNKQIRIEAAVYNVSLDQRSSFQKAISEISSIGYQDIKEGESVDASAIVVNLVHEGVDVKDHLLNTESVEFISDVKLGSYHSMTSLPGGSISFDSTLESSYLADVIDDTYIPGAVNQGYRVQLKPKLKDREISLGYRLDSTGLLNSDEFIKHSGASKFVPVLFKKKGLFCLPGKKKIY